MPGVRRRNRQNNLADREDWQDLRDVKVRNDSYGNRRQLEVVLALATRPRILLMDEPTSGVGPNMIEGFHRLLGSLPRGRSSMGSPLSASPVGLF